MSVSTEEKSCPCLIIKIFNLCSAFFIFPSMAEPQVSRPKRGRIPSSLCTETTNCKEGNEAIYRSFMNLFLAYNIGLHHDMLLLKQIMRAILLSILSQSSHHMLRSTLLMRKRTYVHVMSYERLSACKFNTLTKCYFEKKFILSL